MNAARLPGAWLLPGFVKKAKHKTAVRTRHPELAQAFPDCRMPDAPAAYSVQYTVWFDGQLTR
jgi:hypothetical protein